jgi:hypothetical protein
MDDESKQLLRQLVDAQKEQTELLRKHVLPSWTRIRFSLLALFVLMTLMATGVGFTALAIRSRNASTSPTAITVQTAPKAGSLQLWPTPRVDFRARLAPPTVAGNLRTSPTSTVEVWPTPRVNLRSYDGQVGKEVPTLVSP